MKTETGRNRTDRNKTGYSPDGNEKREHGWNILYPEEKDRYPRYRIIRIKKTEDDLREVNKLLKKINRKSDKKEKTENGSIGKHRGLKKMSAGYTDSGKITSEERQQCMVKMYYGNSEQSHLDHLTKYLTQMKKTEITKKPELFGNISLDEYKERITARYYKWIISPEKKMSVSELKSFAFAYMEKLQEKTGRTYDWQAVVHTNTGHPHIHIVINGKDHEGKIIGKFDPQYVKKWARSDAKNILTGMLGKRTQEEIAAAKERSLNADRFIELDETIESLDMNAEKRVQQFETSRKAREKRQKTINALYHEIEKKYQKQLDEIEKEYGIDPQMDISSKEKEVYYDNVNKHQKPILDRIEKELQEKLREMPDLQQEPPEKHFPIEISDYDSVLGNSPDIRKRLEHLKELGFARYSDRKWTLDDKWQDKLRILGRYNMYLNAKEHVSPDTELKLYESDCGQIRGRLKWIYYMDDEKVWNNAFVIENEEKKTAWYVPVYDLNILKGREGLEDIQQGQEVILRTVKNGKGKLMPRIYSAEEWDKASYKTKYKKENETSIENP